MPGDRVAMPNCLSWRDPDTGQWAAQSATPPAGSLVRIYANVGADAIGYAVEGIVARLVDAAVPFRIKCPGDRTGFARADALVLYIAAADWPSFHPAVAAWAREIEPLLRGGRPALTLALAPGLGFAEDPGDGRSFGQHRCALLAEAMRAIPAPDMLAPFLEQALADAGISAAEPWRSAR